MLVTVYKMTWCHNPYDYNLSLPPMPKESYLRLMLVTLVCVHAGYNSALTGVPYLFSLNQAEAAATLVYWHTESYTILGAPVEGGPLAWT
jgi:hypothetical protein